MQGRSLAQRPAQQPPGVAARTAGMTGEQPRLGFGRKRGQAQQVAPVDAASDRAVSVILLTASQLLPAAQSPATGALPGC